MRMYYFEQLHLGQWRPRTSWAKPLPNPSQNDRPAIRGVVRVAAEHETRPLDEITAIYGTREDASVGAD